MNIINEVKKVFKNSISPPFFEDGCCSEHSFVECADDRIANHYGWELKCGMTKCVLVPLGLDKGNYVYKLPFNGFVLDEDEYNDDEPTSFFPFEGAYHSIEKVRELTQHELNNFDNYCEAEVSIYNAAARSELSSFFLPIEMVDEVEGIPLYRQPKALPSSYNYHECKVESKDAAKVAVMEYNIISSSLLAELYDDYGVNSKEVMELIQFLHTYDITDLDSFNYGRPLHGDRKLKFMDYAGFHS